MAEPMTGEQIAASLINDNQYEIREALKALRTNDRYVLEDQQWERFYFTREVTCLAFGFTHQEADEYLRVVTGQV